MRTLYHYTCVHHLRRIMEDGHLKLCESNLSGHREHAGPDVVWLTSDRGAGKRSHGINGDAADFLSPTHDKTRIRFTVELPSSWPKRWKQWALDRNIERLWMQCMIETGGGPEMAATWWVCERRIEQRFWREIRDMDTDTLLYPLVTL